jgi:predicted protein tyrosine phosphatase
MTNFFFYIIICGVNEVNDFIDDVDAIISIMNPGYQVFAPRSITHREEENPHSVLRLEFDDTWNEVYEPGEELISLETLEEVIYFAQEIVQYNPQANFLIHCHEGISRSTGIAIAIYTALTEDYKLAVEKVAEERSFAKPNIEIIRLTDDLFNLQGKLIDAVLAEFY